MDVQRVADAVNRKNKKKYLGSHTSSIGKFSTALWMAIREMSVKYLRKTLTPATTTATAAKTEGMASPASEKASDAGTIKSIAAARSQRVSDTGSDLRNKYRQLLCDKLMVALDSMEAETLVLAPAQASDAIEEQLHLHFKGNYDQKDFKLRFRLIKDNLGDKSNPDFRRRVLEAEVTPVEVCEMSAEDMASDARKMENEKIRKHKLFHAEAGKALQGTTDQFKCGKCKQRKCTYFQMQTRSADEPMTTFVTCTNCGNRWKFC